MKNEAVYEIAYVTPAEKHCRKQVCQSKVSKVCMELQDLNCYNIRVSFEPLIPGDG